MTLGEGAVNMASGPVDSVNQSLSAESNDAGIQRRKSVAANQTSQGPAVSGNQCSQGWNRDQESMRRPLVSTFHHSSTSGFRRVSPNITGGSPHVHGQPLPGPNNTGGSPHVHGQPLPGPGALDLSHGAHNPDQGAPKPSQGSQIQSQSALNINQGGLNLSQNALNQSQGAFQEALNMSQGSQNQGRNALDMNQGPLNLSQGAQNQGQGALNLSQGAQNQGQGALNLRQNGLNMNQSALNLSQGAQNEEHQQTMPFTGGLDTNCQPPDGYFCNPQQYTLNGSSTPWTQGSTYQGRGYASASTFLEHGDARQANHSEGAVSMDTGDQSTAGPPATNMPGSKFPGTNNNGYPPLDAAPHQMQQQWGTPSGSQAFPATQPQHAPGTGSQAFPATQPQHAPGAGSQSFPAPQPQHPPGTGSLAFPDPQPPHNPGTVSQAFPSGQPQHAPGTDIPEPWSSNSQLPYTAQPPTGTTRAHQQRQPCRPGQNYPRYTAPFTQTFPHPGHNSNLPYTTASAPTPPARWQNESFLGLLGLPPPKVSTGFQPRRSLLPPRQGSDPPTMAPGSLLPPPRGGRLPTMAQGTTQARVHGSDGRAHSNRQGEDDATCTVPQAGEKMAVSGDDDAWEDVSDVSSEYSDVSSMDDVTYSPEDARSAVFCSLCKNVFADVGTLGRHLHWTHTPHPRAGPADTPRTIPQSLRPTIHLESVNPTDACAQHSLTFLPPLEKSSCDSSALCDIWGRHLVVVPEANAEGQLSCPECDEKFPSLESVQTHHILNHQGELPVLWRIHNAHAPEEVANGTGNTRMECLRCYRVFRSPEEIEIHFHSKHPELYQVLLHLLKKKSITESEANTSPHSKANATRLSEANATPHSKAKATPHSKANAIPHSKAKATQHSEAKATPHSKANAIPHSKAKATPHSEANPTQHSAGKEALENNIENGGKASSCIEDKNQADAPPGGMRRCFLCPDCPYYAPYTNSVAVHYKHAHGERLPASVIQDLKATLMPEKREYNCNKCSRKFGYIKNLRKHYLKRHGQNISNEELSALYKTKTPVNTKPGPLSDSDKDIACDSTGKDASWTEKCSSVCNDDEYSQQHVGSSEAPSNTTDTNNHKSTSKELSCDGKVESAQRIRGNSSSGAEGKRLPCPLCPASYTLKGNLKRHIKSNHGNHEGKDLSDRETLDKNIKPSANCDTQRPSSTNKEFVPDTTGKDESMTEKCSSVSNDNKPSQQHVGSSETISNLGSKSTEMNCDQVASSRSGTEGKRFPCPLCPATYTLECSVSRHIKDKHSTKYTDGCKYTCPKCQRKFVSKSALGRHLNQVHVRKVTVSHPTKEAKTATAVSGISCSLCEKSFKFKSSLDIHMKMHAKAGHVPPDTNKPEGQETQGSKPEVQETRGNKPEVDTRTASAISEPRHIKRRRLHSQVCSICEKCFKFKSSLDIHMKMHAKAGHVPPNTDKPEGQETQGSKPEVQKTKGKKPEILETQDNNTEPEVQETQVNKTEVDTSTASAILEPRHVKRRRLHSQVCMKKKRFANNGKMKNAKGRPDFGRTVTCPLCPRIYKSDIAVRNHFREKHGSVDELNRARAALLIKTADSVGEQSVVEGIEGRPGAKYEIVGDKPAEPEATSPVIPKLVIRKVSRVKRKGGITRARQGKKRRFRATHPNVPKSSVASLPEEKASDVIQGNICNDDRNDRAEKVSSEPDEKFAEDEGNGYDLVDDPAFESSDNEGAGKMDTSCEEGEIKGFQSSLLGDDEPGSPRLESAPESPLPPAHHGDDTMNHLPPAHPGEEVMNHLPPLLPGEDTGNHVLCTDCGQKFSSAERLRAHCHGGCGTQRTPHAEGQLRCSACSKTFSSQYFLSAHERIHRGEAPYSCHVCAQEFSDHGALTRHVENHDTGTGTTENAAQDTTGSDSQESMNVTAGNKQESMNIAAIVDKKQESLNIATKAGKKQESLNITKTTSKKQFKCENCGKTYSSKHSLTRHKVDHCDTKPYSCDHCEKGFYFRDNLVQHLAENHGINPPGGRSIAVKPPTAKLVKPQLISCSICEKTFSQASHLMRHMTKAHEGKTFACSGCSRKFIRRDKLIDHQNSEGGCTGPHPVTDQTHPDKVTSGIHKCDLCPELFTSDYGRRRHVECVHEKARHTCDVCSRSFTRADTLKRHALVHLQMQPFSCDLCARSCVNISGLELHASHVHKILVVPVRKLPATRGISSEKPGGKESMPSENIRRKEIVPSEKLIRKDSMLNGKLEEQESVPAENNRRKESTPSDKPRGKKRKPSGKSRGMKRKLLAKRTLTKAKKIVKSSDKEASTVNEATEPANKIAQENVEPPTSGVSLIGSGDVSEVNDVSKDVTQNDVKAAEADTTAALNVSTGSDITTDANGSFYSCNNCGRLYSKVKSILLHLERRNCHTGGDTGEFKDGYEVVPGEQSIMGNIGNAGKDANEEKGQGLVTPSLASADCNKSPAGTTDDKVHSDESQSLKTGRPSVKEVTNVSEDSTVNAGTAFTCDVCGVVLSCKKNLIRHKQTVHGNTRHHCNLCDRKYKHRTDLMRHQASEHNPEGVNKCQVCQKVCASENGLRVHSIMVHSVQLKKGFKGGRKRKLDSGVADDVTDDDNVNNVTADDVTSEGNGADPHKSSQSVDTANKKGAAEDYPALDTSDKVYTEGTVTANGFSSGNNSMKASSISGQDTKTTSISGQDTKTTSISGQDTKTTSISGQDTKTTSISGQDTKTTSISGQDTKTTSISGQDTKTTSISGEETGSLQTNEAVSAGLSGDLSVCDVTPQPPISALTSPTPQPPISAHTSPTPQPPISALTSPGSMRSSPGAVSRFNSILPSPRSSYTLPSSLQGPAAAIVPPRPVIIPTQEVITTSPPGPAMLRTPTSPPGPAMDTEITDTLTEVQGADECSTMHMEEKRMETDPPRTSTPVPRTTSSPVPRTTSSPVPRTTSSPVPRTSSLPVGDNCVPTTATSGIQAVPSSSPVSSRVRDPPVSDVSMAETPPKSGGAEKGVKLGELRRNIFDKFQEEQTGAALIASNSGSKDGDGSSLAMSSSKDSGTLPVGHAQDDTQTQHKCAKCSKTFPEASRLKIHLNIHTDRFRCHVCARRFVCRRHLERHEDTTHTSILRPFSCGVCDMSFSRTSSLKRHVLTHTQVRPFVCPVCGLAFKDPKVMRKHKRSHVTKPAADPESINTSSV